MVDSQRNLSNTLKPSSLTSSQTPKPRDWILRNARLPTLSPKEPFKEEEELSELTVESHHTSPATVTSNSASLKSPVKSPEPISNRLELPRSKPPSQDSLLANDLLAIEWLSLNYLE